MPLEGVVLNMKAMNIDQVVNFPFPTPPPRESLFKAEKVRILLFVVSFSFLQCNININI